MYDFKRKNLKHTNIVLDIIVNMEPILSFLAVALLVGGLVGQGFELRKIRTSITKDEDLSSKNMFTNRRNLKWYAIIAVGMVLWYVGRQL